MADGDQIADWAARRFPISRSDVLLQDAADEALFESATEIARVYTDVEAIENHLQTLRGRQSGNGFPAVERMLAELDDFAARYH